MFWKQCKISFLIFFVFTLITGVIYPLLVTGIAQSFFREKANGSIIYHDGRAVGSLLIGQKFDDPKYFWGRPSSTTPPYNAASSSGSNLGPTNNDFLNTVESRAQKLKVAGLSNKRPIPVDLITASGSGLDPHISLAAAYYQIPRVARLRNMSEKFLENLVKKHIEKRFFGFLGEPVINILKINIELDKQQTQILVTEK